VRLQYARHGEISSAHDLALIIVDETSRVFFDRTKTNTKQPNLLELFAAAIRDLAYKQTAAFDQFLIYTHLASRDYKRQRYVSSDNSSQNHLLNINPEGELLKEIKDVMDEITIIMRIQEQQQAVMDSFVKHLRRALTPLLRSQRPTTSHSTAPWHLALDDDNPSRHLEDHRRQTAKRTLLKADTLLLDQAERISELRTLLQNAQNTSAALKDLLTLKQQQAGVIEAREAVKQAQLTLKQGQSIMIFTIVTIIFLPLSFCASVFGMNAAELNEGLLPLATELRLMFPVSAGIILTSFLFAFSRGVFTNSVVMLARSGVSFVWNTAWTWVAVKTGLYVVGREMLTKANRLREREGTITGGMKAEVLRREKNLERMRAAGHVRALARQRGDDGQRVGSGGGGGDGMVSPGLNSAGIPGSPSPLLASRGGSVADIEMGERSSQVHLVPGR
jgi:Mg2+ and Co2+ transporter CorA